MCEFCDVNGENCSDCDLRRLMDQRPPIHIPGREVYRAPSNSRAVGLVVVFCGFGLVALTALRLYFN